VSERRTYQKFSAQQKTELVLAALKGHKTIAELARERDISETLLRRWREQFLAGGAEKLQGKTERTQLDELRASATPAWSARWGARRWSLRSRGNSCGDGSDRARRPYPRAGRRRTFSFGRGARRQHSLGRLSIGGPSGHLAAIASHSPRQTG